MLTEVSQRDSYLSSLDPYAIDQLNQLRQRMTAYYRSTPYPQTIRTLTANWHDQVHQALCTQILAGSRILEVGCGDGSGARVIKQMTGAATYFGCDLSYGEWIDNENLLVSSAEAQPFPSASLDAVFSLYVIEHLVFPARFLDESWRLLRPGGRLLIVAPNFSTTAMASERIGLSYGSGSAKLRGLRPFDALLTAYDSRIRIPRWRQQRQASVARGICEFPILSQPRCLRLDGFVVDCDALYPACPSEITTYLQRQPDYAGDMLFFYNTSTFGLIIHKAH